MKKKFEFLQDAWKNIYNKKLFESNEEQFKIIKKELEEKVSGIEDLKKLWSEFLFAYNNEDAKKLIETKLLIEAELPKYVDLSRGKDEETPLSTVDIAKSMRAEKPYKNEEEFRVRESLANSESLISRINDELNDMKNQFGDKISPDNLSKISKVLQNKKISLHIAKKAVDKGDEIKLKDVQAIKKELDSVIQAVRNIPKVGLIDITVEPEKMAAQNATEPEIDGTGGNKKFSLGKSGKVTIDGKDLDVGISDDEIKSAKQRIRFRDLIQKAAGADEPVQPEEPKKVNLAGLKKSLEDQKSDVNPELYQLAIDAISKAESSGSEEDIQLAKDSVKNAFENS